MNHLTTHILYKNVSGAASVVIGGNANDLKAWKYNGQALADCERNL